MNITIGEVLTGIAMLGVAVTYIFKALSPFENLKKRVDEHDATLITDNNRLNELEDGNKVICRTLLAIVSHELNGNSIDNLKKAKDALQDYLIEK